MKKQMIGTVIFLFVILFAFSAQAVQATEVIIARGNGPTVKLTNAQPYAYLNASGFPEIGGDESNYHYKFQDGNLILRNCSTENDYVYVICEKGDLVINLVESNMIKLIEAEGALTFTGTGNLKLLSITSRGNLTFDGQGTIDVGYRTASGLHTDNRAIFCSKDITINSGFINAMAGNVVSAGSPSPGGTWAPGDSIGIHTHGNIVVNGGTVVVQSGKTPQFSNSYAIRLENAIYHANEIKSKAITIKGGSVTATAGGSSGGNQNQSASSVAISGNVKLEGGSLTLKSGDVGSYGGSVGVNMRMEQSGGSFRADADLNRGTSSSRSSAVGTIAFTGGTAIMTAYEHAANKAEIAKDTVVTSSTNRDGTSPEVFDSSRLQNYKYLKLELNPTPTAKPTTKPTTNPTANPTGKPTPNPTANPTPNSTANPTPSPTWYPPTATPNTSLPPKTGDYSHIELWIALVGFSILGIKLLLAKKRA